MMGITKAGVFHTFGTLPWETALRGLLVGKAVTVGSFVAKRLMHRISTDNFKLMMDGVLLVAGLLRLAGVLR